MKHIKKFNQINEGKGDWIRTIQTLFDKSDVGSFLGDEIDFEMFQKWDNLLPYLDQYGEINNSKPLGPIEETIRHFEKKDLKKHFIPMQDISKEEKEIKKREGTPTVYTAFGEHEWNLDSYNKEYQDSVKKLRKAWMSFLKEAGTFAGKADFDIDTDTGKIIGVSRGRAH
jgi:hypothetical protein